MRFLLVFFGSCLLAAAPAAAQAPAQVATPAPAPAPQAAQPAPQPAHEPVIAPAPAWVVPVAVPAANPAMGDRPVQALLVSNQTLFGAGTQDNYSELVFLIQNAQGMQAFGNITLPWQPDQSELIVHKIQILRGGQVIDLLAGHPFTVLRRENNLESAMLDGVLTAVMQPEGLAVGDVLTIAFTVRRHGGALPLRGENSFFLTYGQPVRHFYLRQIWPTGSPIRWRGTGIMQQARTRATPRGTELVLDLSDAEGPQPAAQAPARLALPTTFQLSEYRDWAEVSAAMAPHFAAAETLAPNSPLRHEIERIAAATNDPRRRAMMALRLVEEEVRYLALAIGDGNYVPATADQTWSRRFADCKGKVVTLLALLHGLGIDAEPVLVNATLGDALSERLPGLSLFNHVIVRARIDGRSYWLDGTRTGDRNLDDLASSTFSWGLPLRASGATLEPLPYAPPALPLFETNVTADGTNGLIGNVPTRMEQVMRGEAAAAMRMALSQLGRDEFLRRFRESITSQMPAEMGQVDNVDLRDDPESGTLTFIVTGRGRLNWTQTPGSATQRYRFSNNIINWNVSFDRPAGPFHDAPFAFEVPAYAAMTETIVLPHGGQGFSLEAQNFDHVVAGTRISRQISIANGRAVAHSEFRRMEREVSAQAARQGTSLIAAMRDDRAYLQGPVGPAGQPVLAAGPNQPASGAPAHPAREPVSAQDFVARGYARLQAESLDEAAADFERAGTLNPRWSRPLAARATVLIERGHLDEAEPLLAQAAQRDPNDSMLHQARGLILLARHRPVQAIVEFYRTLELEPGNLFTLQERAAAFAQLGEYDDALADLGEVLARDPQSRQALTARARLHAWRGEAEPAIADANAIVALDPHDPAILYERATILRRLGRTEAANAAYTETLAAIDARVAATPNEADDYDGMRSVVLSESGQTARAIGLIDAQLARHADSASLLNERCWTRATANVELALALADCEQAVQRAPDNSAILDSRAFVKLRMGQYDAAIADEDQALSHNPDHPAALYTRGIARLRKGDRDGGERDLAAARRLVFDIDAIYRDYGVTP